MAYLFNYTKLLEEYSSFQNSNFLGRYIDFNSLENFLSEEIFTVFDYEIIGFSELKKPIYVISIGKGLKKVLLWSQMHGNESTTTKSLLDVLNYFKNNQSEPSINSLLKTCTLKIILMLNPDGASMYSRLNANEIDLNRDAIHCSQKETQCFFEYLKKFNPDFCFNMHGQRTIFSAGQSNSPASLSFLAPSYNFELSTNNSREKAMKLIVSAHKMLLDFIPGQIGKYDDAHNPNCFGDKIQKMGISTVLFEAGHYPGDYNRNITRKFVTLSVFKMLETIASDKLNDYMLEDYKDIPDNQKKHLDIIITNVSNSESGYVGIQYNEVLSENQIIFKPYIKTLDDLSSFIGHRIIDANSKPIKINGKSKIDKDVNINELKIEDTIIEMKL